MQGVSINSVIRTTLRKTWGELYDEYVNFINNQDIEKAVEIIVLTLRSELRGVSFDTRLQDTDLTSKNVWIDEIIQKDEFLELAKKEAKIRIQNEMKKHQQIAA